MCVCEREREGERERGKGGEGERERGGALFAMKVLVLTADSCSGYWRDQSFPLLKQMAGQECI